MSLAERSVHFGVYAVHRGVELCVGVRSCNSGGADQPSSVHVAKQRALQTLRLSPKALPRAKVLGLARRQLGQNQRPAPAHCGVANKVLQHLSLWIWLSAHLPDYPKAALLESATTHIRYCL